jgi:hypothetical protein
MTDNVRVIIFERDSRYLTAQPGREGSIFELLVAYSVKTVNNSTRLNARFLPGFCDASNQIVLWPYVEVD